MFKLQGFTLIELLVVLAIVAIMMAIGVPSYRFIANTSRVASEVNALVGDMQFARSEAIKRGMSVSLCAAASSACTGATSWNSGWIVFTDTNGNGALDTGDAIVRIQPAFSADQFTASNSVSAISFNREGYISGLVADPVTIKLQPANTTSTNWTRCVAISMLGRFRIQTIGQGNCS